MYIICLGSMKSMSYRFEGRVMKLLEGQFGKNMIALNLRDGMTGKFEIDADATFSNFARFLSTGKSFPRAGRNNATVIHALLKILSIIDTDFSQLITVRTRNVMEVTAGTALGLEFLIQV